MKEQSSRPETHLTNGEADGLREDRERWERDVLAPWLEQAPERPSELFELDAGPEAAPLYTPLDLLERGIEHERDIGLPGAFPFTRGATPNGPRSRPPLVKFYSGQGTPEETNRRYRKLRDWGVEQIQIASDLPSQVGYDPDHIMAAGEVGRAGVSIASLRDLEVMFDGLPLTSFKRVGALFSSLGPLALALFVALGEQQGLTTDDYVVDLQNDPLKEYSARGTQFLPIRPATRLAADVVEWCVENAPHWYPLDVCVNHLNAAGAGSSSGTAFALANARCYIEELLGRGLEIDSFAPLLQMFLDERDDLFAAVANIRATRRIWARMLRDDYGARDPRSLALHVTAYGHGRETRQEPLNNIVRTTLGTLAYYLGGVQTLYNASYDEALAIPSDVALKIAVRMQQILTHEQGISLTVDPLGGSYYVESLTSDLERLILDELARVDEQGGAIACIENGYVRSVIVEGAVRRQRRFEAGSRAMVGVNVLASDDEPEPVDVLRVDAEVEEVQRRRLAEVKAERDAGAVGAALAAVTEAARSGANVVPSVIEAVRSYATVGEVADVFRSVFGEWEPDRAF
ncbi:MAG TPA: methylmalonyl-CoA mutase family protein [Gaiellaceae bacterium]|nr:methylmalonyl-CoA mutase family protein [Gaiellaceae bacterium]